MAPGMVVRDQYEPSHHRSRPHLRPTSTDVRSRRPHRRASPTSSSSAPAPPGSPPPTSSPSTGSPPPSSRPTTSSAASAAPSSATAGASTSAATASSPRCSRGRGPLARDPRPTRTSCMRPRMSRIYYQGKFYDYPLKAVQRAAQPRPHRGGPLRRCRTSGSGSARRRTRRRSRAGSPPASAGASTGTSSRPTPRRCGASRPTEMPADWAAQRIKNLSLVQGGHQRAAARSGTRRTSPA